MNISRMFCLSQMYISIMKHEKMFGVGTLHPKRNFMKVKTISFKCSAFITLVG